MAGTVPTPAELIAAGGGGSIPTTTADVWGTGTYGTMAVHIPSGPGKSDKGATNDQFAAGIGGENILTPKIPNQKPDSDPLSSLLDYAATTSANANATTTVNAALAAGYKMSSSQLTSLQQKLWLAGMYQGTGVSVVGQIPFGQYDENTVTAYANLLKLNAAQNARGSSTGLNDTLGGLIKQQTQIKQNQAPGQTNTDISLSDPEQAKSVLTNILQAYEGRGIPNPDEIASFQTALNQFETQHATTSTQNADGSVTTKEGVGVLSAASRNQFAQDWLIKNEGGQVANSQAATSYYQAAMSSLAAPVQLGQN